MCAEPAFGGDGVWPPKHDYVERVASWCCIRSIMMLPTEYRDRPIREASVKVLFLAEEPEAPRVLVKGTCVVPMNKVNLTLRVE